MFVSVRENIDVHLGVNSGARQGQQGSGAVESNCSVCAAHSRRGVRGV